MTTNTNATNLFSMAIGFEAPRNFDNTSAFTEPYGIRVSGEFAQLEQRVNLLEFRLKSDISSGQYNIEKPEVRSWIIVQAGLINTSYTPNTLKLTITIADHPNKHIVANYEINAEENHPEGSGTPITVKGDFDIYYK